MRQSDERFIGRNEELAFLNERYESGKSQLIIIYGRRRIGKTETIRRFCKGKKAVLFTCTQTEDSQQLRNFSNAVFSSGFNAGDYAQEFRDWNLAFLSVKDYVRNENGKSILVIDEFPYMVRGNSEIASILQKQWDGILKHENVMVILCGSAMGYIEKEILAEKNPLYGRSTGIYKMEPMHYRDAALFVPSYGLHDKIATYSMLGGIPYYLEQFDDSLPLKDNIVRAIIRKGSILYTEPEFLLRQELREPATYNAIIQAIAYGKTKFNEIQDVTLIEKSKLSVYLKNLIELGFVCREFPVLCANASRQNRHRGVYRLKDFFFRFWYAFVFPNLTLLEFGDVETVYESIIKDRLDDFISYPFEDICIDYLKCLNMKGGLPFAFTQIGRWWDDRTEIDAVAVDSHRLNYLSAECKFRRSPADREHLKKHIEKDLRALNVRGEARVHHFYFSWNGFTDMAVKFAAEKGISLVSGEDLFNIQRPPCPICQL